MDDMLELPFSISDICKAREREGLPNYLSIYIFQLEPRDEKKYKNNVFIENKR